MVNEVHDFWTQQSDDSQKSFDLFWNIKGNCISAKNVSIFNVFLLELAWFAILISSLAFLIVKTDFYTIKSSARLIIGLILIMKMMTSTAVGTLYFMILKEIDE